MPKEFNLAYFQTVLANPRHFDFARDDMGKRVGSMKFMMLSRAEADALLKLLPKRSLTAQGKVKRTTKAPARTRTQGAR